MRRTLIKYSMAFAPQGLYKEAFHLQKQLMMVLKGFDRLQVSDTTVTLSMEIWFDLINKELQPHKDQILK